LLNSIIAAISLKLKQEFGSEMPVYTEVIKQGSSMPCFFVCLQTSTNKKMLGKRYLMEHKFLIQYYPATNSKNAEILDTIERLNTTLEYVEVNGDLLRGSKKIYENINNILNFYVCFNFFAYWETEAKETMENLSIGTGLGKSNES
jgi:hypothetical protein